MENKMRERRLQWFGHKEGEGDQNLHLLENVRDLKKKIR
jgi:hypothetical protein